MELPSNPKPPVPKRPVTIWQLAVVLLFNRVILEVGFRVIERRQLLILLWLPLLNILAGAVLQATRYARLGRVLMLGTLVIALIGLGTCGLLLMAN